MLQYRYLVNRKFCWQKPSRVPYIQDVLDGTYKPVAVFLVSQYFFRIIIRRSIILKHRFWSRIVCLKLRKFTTKIFCYGLSFLHWLLESVKCSQILTVYASMLCYVRMLYRVPVPYCNLNLVLRIRDVYSWSRFFVHSRSRIQQ